MLVVQIVQVNKLKYDFLNSQNWPTFITEKWNSQNNYIYQLMRNIWS
jgi:hypothetical protein